MQITSWHKLNWFVLCFVTKSYSELNLFEVIISWCARKCIYTLHKDVLPAGTSMQLQVEGSVKQQTNTHVRFRYYIIAGQYHDQPWCDLVRWHKTFLIVNICVIVLHINYILVWSKKLTIFCRKFKFRCIV